MVKTDVTRGLSMAKLSDDQLAFFAAHGLRESDAFDASGMRRAAYQAQMRALKNRSPMVFRLARKLAIRCGR